MDNTLHLLGIAQKAGRLEVGEEPVGAAARARQARVILLACDAAANTARRAGHFGEAGNVLWLTVPYTKAELGGAVGRASCGPHRRGPGRLPGEETGRRRSGAIRPRL